METLDLTRVGKFQPGLANWGKEWIDRFDVALGQQGWKPIAAVPESWIEDLAAVYTPFACLRLLRRFGADALDASYRLNGFPALKALADELGLVPMGKP